MSKAWYDIYHWGQMMIMKLAMLLGVFLETHKECFWCRMIHFRIQDVDKGEPKDSFGPHVF